MRQGFRNVRPKKHETPGLCRRRGLGRRPEMGLAGSALLNNVGSLETLGPLDHIELHLLTLGQALEALSLDGGEVDEDILAPFLLDEAVTLGVVEPLHFSSSHS